MRKPSNTRTFTTQLEGLVSQEDYESIERLLDFLNAETDRLLNDDDFISCGLKNIGEYKTEFVKAMSSDYGKPYNGWDVTYPSKYYRIVLNQCHRNFKSLEEKVVLARICEKHEWKHTKSAVKEIQEEAYKELKHYVRNSWIHNICKSQAMPKYPDSMNIVLDYTIEDDNIGKVFDDGDSIRYELYIDNRWIVLSVRKPKHMREQGGKLMRPQIYRDVNNNGKILVKSCYEARKEDRREEGGTLGIDLGFKRYFTATVLYPDRALSKEFHPTRELEKVNDKMRTLSNDKEALTKKIDSVDLLLAGKTNEKLARKNEARRQERSRLLAQLSELKREAARLAARDIVALAKKEKCQRIQFENLSLLNDEGAQITARWEHSMIIRCTENLAYLEGIAVAVVNPSLTSRTDSFTNEEVVPRSDRKVSTSVGLLDRDYIGSGNAARGEGKKNVRKCEPAIAKSSGFASDFERARPERRCSHVGFRREK